MITVDELKEYCIKLMESLDVLVPISDERKYTQEEVFVAETNLRNNIFDLLVDRTFEVYLSDEEYRLLDMIGDVSQKILDKYLNIEYINQKIIDPNYSGGFNKEQLTSRLEELNKELRISLMLFRGIVGGTLNLLSGSRTRQD